MNMEVPILEIENISKSFPGVKALHNVSFSLKKAEIVGLVGENGAGKSTLVRIITGVYPKDQGIIKINGKKIEIHNPYESRMIHKIAYVSQESTLCPDLSVAENIFLGNWKKGKFNLVDWKTSINESDLFIKQLGLNLSSKTLVKHLRSADRQLVEIARALSIESDILLLDEPTSWLSEKEKVFLFEKIKALKERGVGIVFISHFLEEVLKISNRIHVLRDGKTVGVIENKGITRDELIKYILGEKKEIKKENTLSTMGNVTLEVKNVYKEKQVEDISFVVKEGEIVGFTGLFGSGKTELARIIFGLTKPDKGQIKVFGKKLKWQDVNYSKSLSGKVGRMPAKI
jgi:ABC-type sugar transport system ATPase subunit